MKVVFLDVDGVLNNFSLIQRFGFDYIDSGMVGTLGRIVRGSGADIVLSSSWRVDPKDRAMVSVALGAHGMSLLGSTPVLNTFRSEEISGWLKANPEVERYAILDDDDDAGFGMAGSFFQTDPEVGLTAAVASAALSHLNGGSND